MRRPVAVGTLVPLVLLLAACGSGTTTTPTPNTVIGNVPTTSTTPSGGGKGDAAAGKTVFTSNCSACHTLADANAKGTVGPNLDDLKPDDATVARQVTNGGGAMPAFKDSLSPQQIQDVAAYVSSVAGQ
ncbi:MAG TPA: c-type cytochrome [Gaiellaceae bacterium]|nr:c-type cytochrome [Gaiellaceae bacterium]